MYIDVLIRGLLSIIFIYHGFLGLSIIFRLKSKNFATYWTASGIIIALLIILGGAERFVDSRLFHLIVLSTALAVGVIDIINYWKTLKVDIEMYGYKGNDTKDGEDKPTPTTTRCG